MQDRTEVIQKVQSLLDTQSADDIIIPVLDRLAVLGGMSKASFGQMLQPKGPKKVWEPHIEKAVTLGILVYLSLIHI